MSKYQGLSDHLAGQSGKEWRASFDDVSALLGGALPKTARSGVAWWANDASKAQAKAWLDQGWQVRDVDPKAGTVIFMKTESAKPKKAAAKGAKAKTASKSDAAKPKAAGKPKAKAPEPAPAETAASVAGGSTSAPEAKPAGEEPAFLNRLPGGQKTAVMGGLAAAVVGVGALIARAFLRKR